MSQPPPHQPPPSPYQPQGQPPGQRPTVPPQGGGFGPPVPPAPPTPPTPGQPSPSGGGFGPPDAPDASTASAFPAAAPGPYGPGAAPPQQPPVPPAPPPRPGGPGPGPGRARRSRIVLAVAAAVALLAAGGVTTALLLGGEDGQDPSPDPTATATGPEEEADGPTGPVDASLAWQAYAPEVTDEEINEDPRSIWFSGDTVVRAIDDAITARDLRTGEEVWSLPLETSAGNCQSSRNADEDRVAVLQGRDCEVLTVFDIAAGAEVTSIQAGSGYGDSGVPAILGDTVAVGYGFGSDGFSISSGRQIWQRDSGDDCPDTAYAVIDGMFISRADCSLGDKGGLIRATTAEGEELWAWRYGEFEGATIVVKNVISIDPLIVVDHADDDYERERILVVDEEHQSVAHALDYDPDRYTSPCSLASLAECNGVAVHDGFLYLASFTGQENEVVGFDLSTGHADFEVEPYADERDQAAREEGEMRLLIQPFAVADGQILAYQRDDRDELRPGTVVAIDPETEKAIPVMNLDPEASEREAFVIGRFTPFDRLILWHDGTLLMAPVTFNYDHIPGEDPALLVYR